ncbi:hypothetical protein I203_102392 [Kwoniella mangroviensis CBS 8507]|uniref:uncharacterized protein n=1 Tax=Kwoniella mangroviensis CBS 8507 TaxID=1296122 RepID=UPI00080D13C6|nr:uncharacterized protein I203_06512 [Kwoniella mangroviensis CBS 8507]OCF64331.1 hypothetical protein I203_06512 [Kwoniella mangroviensis CBS 8507]
MPVSTDFSSPVYWSNRFESEQSFEWLISDQDLLPFIEENLPQQFLLPYEDTTQNEKGDEEDHQQSAIRPEKTLNVLHFGSGTSSLGSSLQRYFDSAKSTYKTKARGKCKDKVQVYDSDYVPTPQSSHSSDVDIPFILLDVLSLQSLKSNTPEDQWDLIIDKSTCDAISCGGALPRLTVDQEEEEENGSIPNPIERLLYNLSKVTKIGGRWISISYSSNRFDDEIYTRYGWKLIKKQMISTTYIPGGRIVKDPRSGEERVVHEPETGVWMYVLERV